MLAATRHIPLQHAQVLLMIVLSVWVLPGAIRAQTLDHPPQEGVVADVPSLDDLMSFANGQSDLRVALERYAEDRAALHRRYDVEFSPTLRARMRLFYRGWQSRLEELDFEALNHEGQADYVMLSNRLVFELETLDAEERFTAEMAPLIPFAPVITELQERRRDREPIVGRAAAQTLDDLADEVEALTSTLRSSSSGEPSRAERVSAFRAANHLGSLRRTLRDWYTYYSGYDPLFTWWAETAYIRADEAIAAHVDVIREDLAGILGSDQDPIIGDPIGAEGLRAHLAHEMIPYAAEELIAIGYAELAWCEEQLLIASREMGYGDNWQGAQEAVKELAVPPGGKPEVIRQLANQSLTFIEESGTITLPPLAAEIWRMQMMTPERQLINPFFTGGEVLSVSYPTNTMGHDLKLMSMRGNNPHFNRATVHHELIPGHHLQGFMSDRFNGHRNMFRTPFWGEGWAVYWEMLLWDQGFTRGPEDKIGMLFWRMHRAARIIFSLSFHLEQMTPQEAIDFLVERVGHEYANAEAEVRRSFQSTYSPLYQVGYMMGALQFRALYEELVDSGQMTAREYHDAVLLGGRMPVEMVRARLTGQEIDRDHQASWRFYGDPLGGRDQ
ncbi:MAG: DUF885 family protein [Gemmatimonadales bacterium]|nr:DUF885 family protein [Gemmatimonadales bacterium]MDG2239092.1 DUF885 family protein [Longimicrobiales bacterium]MBT3499982.1 DUF885 family protein [Gemmatimonadales bacterium]MBT4437034.1 DUF885 family protein [Gemmatimonadales bacterium]MBT4914734.1 DUF885 family protein [Gemmatimonadales bacterium]